MYRLRLPGRSLRCRLAGRALFPGLHLPLEPIDLILDGLPGCLGCQPVERSVPLLFGENRRISEALVEGDLLLRGRVRSGSADRLPPFRRTASGTAVAG